jgi:hypothetical protein
MSASVLFAAMFVFSNVDRQNWYGCFAGHILGHGH